LEGYILPPESEEHLKRKSQVIARNFLRRAYKVKHLAASYKLLAIFDREKANFGPPDQIYLPPHPRYLGSYHLLKTAALIYLEPKISCWQPEPSLPDVGDLL
jgi:hypothetical protein